jgi:hypothetical protein
MAISVAIASSNNGRTLPLGTLSLRPSSRTTAYMASHDRRLRRRDLPVDGKTPRATVDAWRRLAWGPQGLRRIRICAT